MYWQRVLLSALAATSALAFPFGKNDEAYSPAPDNACLGDCVRMTILPFIEAAGEEGFRQALGAHNTTQECMNSLDCRDTLEILVEEIRDNVLKDLLQASKAPRHQGQYHVGQHCDSDCLVATAKTTAGRAGVAAMALGQKHFYGTRNMWSRWSPRQVLELDQAMNQLNGTGRFGISSLRYSTIPEIPLLYHRKITIEEAKKLVSAVPGWGAKATEVAPEDHNRWLYGNAFSHYWDSLLAMGSARADNEAPVKFNYNHQQTMQGAYALISDGGNSSSLDNFVHFLYSQRLFEKDKVANTQMLANESFVRMMLDAETSPQTDAAVQMNESTHWDWFQHAFGVRNLEELAFTPAKQNRVNGLWQARVFYQWATDSQATPLKWVESGFTHQPWTNPFFFEYRTNTSHSQELNPDMTYEEAQNYLDWVKEGANGTAIRGYTMAFDVLEKMGLARGLEVSDIWDERGGLKDLEMLAPRFSGKNPWIFAISNDGRVLPRFLGETIEKARGKTIYQVLGEANETLYTEEGKPIKLIYDDKTGLLETRYGRSLMSLDKNVQPFA